jgi:hypothetical protein
MSNLYSQDGWIAAAFEHELTAALDYMVLNNHKQTKPSLPRVNSSNGNYAAQYHYGRNDDGGWIKASIEYASMHAEYVQVCEVSAYITSKGTAPRLTPDTLTRS